jgi:hypothetical protein
MVWRHSLPGQLARHGKAKARTRHGTRTRRLSQPGGCRCLRALAAVKEGAMGAARGTVTPHRVGNPVYGSRSEDRRCILAITSRLTAPSVSDGTCTERAAPRRILSYVSSTRRAISSRLEPTTCLAIVFVIDALISCLLTGFPGSMGRTGPPFRIEFASPFGHSHSGG